jgi:hypothetical protein
MNHAVVFVVLALAGGILLARTVVKFGQSHPVAFRFMAGLPLDGRPRTDAGWLRPGVRVLHPIGHASKWAHLPHLHRAGIRWAVLAVVVATCVGLALNLRLTLGGLAAVATVAVGLCVVLAGRAVRERAHVRRYVRPLHLALAPAIGIPRAVRPTSWLTVPRGFGQIEGAKIRIRLPDGFLTTADAKRVIMTALADKLAIEDAAVEWAMVGSKPSALITTSSPPPDKVTLDRVRDILASAPESAPVIGLGRKQAVVSADFDADSPHGLVSAGSGGGKSTIVRVLLAQELNKGALGVMCDIKRISHAWARGLPNVRYCRSIAEIHDALILVKAEVDRRNELVDELADDDGNVSADVLERIGPRLILVMEEMNATANRLAAHWRKIKDKEDPAVSPAVEALNDILFMGRAVRVNVLAVAQMMTARALGGPEARENFATRILARYTLNAWKMLVPEVWPMPRTSRHAGRVQVVMAGVARETQVIYVTPAEARALATSGTVSRFAAVAAGAALTGSQTAPVQGTEPVSLTGPDVHLVGEVEPVGLREAIESGALSVTLEVARWARANDPEFPKARGKRGQELLYAPGELGAWQRNRQRSADDDESGGEVASNG